MFTRRMWSVFVTILTKIWFVRILKMDYWNSGSPKPNLVSGNLKFVAFFKRNKEFLIDISLVLYQVHFLSVFHSVCISIEIQTVLPIRVIFCSWAPIYPTYKNVYISFHSPLSLGYLIFYHQGLSCMYFYNCQRKNNPFVKLLSHWFQVINFNNLLAFTLLEIWQWELSCVLICQHCEFCDFAKR